MNNKEPELNQAQKEQANDALSAAAIAGDLEAAKAAIANGAEAHIDGDSAVYANNIVRWAANSGNAKLVTYLLKNGAEQQPFDEESIISAADNKEMLAAFLKYWRRYEGYVYVELLERATERKNWEIGEMLVPYCARAAKHWHGDEAIEKFRDAKARFSAKVRSSAKRENVIALLRDSVLPKGWAMDFCDDAILLSIPYSQKDAAQMRALKAKWYPEQKVWRLGFSKADRLAGALKSLNETSSETSH